MTRALRGVYLGRRPYLETHDLMMRLFEARRREQVGDTVLLLEHAPVITLGRTAKPAHLLRSEAQLKELGVDLVDTGRGGDVTLHAPGQLVAYPVLNLQPDRCDVRKYVELLTSVMQALVADCGYAAGPKHQMIGLWADAAQPNRYDVAAQDAGSPVKLGAIGVRISRWVTTHGFALNLRTDLRWFQLIVPCGISEYPVASIESLSERAPELLRWLPSPEEAAQPAFEHFVSRWKPDHAAYHHGADSTFSELFPELDFKSSLSEREPSRGS